MKSYREARVKASQHDGSPEMGLALTEWAKTGIWKAPTKRTKVSAPFIIEISGEAHEVNPGDWVVRTRAGLVSVMNDEQFAHYEEA